MTSLPIEETGPEIVFDAAFDGEQSVGTSFRPAASRPSQPKNGMHPNDDVSLAGDGSRRGFRTADDASTDHVN